MKIGKIGRRICSSLSTKLSRWPYKVLTGIRKHIFVYFLMLVVNNLKSKSVVIHVRGTKREYAGENLRGVSRLHPSDADFSWYLRENTSWLTSSPTRRSRPTDPLMEHRTIVSSRPPLSYFWLRCLQGVHNKPTVTALFPGEFQVLIP